MNENNVSTEHPLSEPQIMNLIAEFGKVTMNQCAITLSSILNKEVTIDTPKVEHVPFKQILSELEIPKVSTVVEFKDGLKGTSILLLNVSDAILIADLMTGGSGEPINTEFTEMELSAIGEAVNQMTGSSTTSLATLIGKKVDIFQPKVNLWENETDVDYKEIGTETFVSKVSFKLMVDGVIDSEIVQIYTSQMMEQIAQLTLKNSEKMTEGNESMDENKSEEQQVKKERSRKQKSRKVTIQQPEFDDLDSIKKESHNDNFDLLMDVPLDFSVVLGTRRKSIKEILSLGVGSVVELDSLTDEPLDIYVNSKLIAQGEVVVINENFGVRITSILSQKQRINKLN